MRKLKVLSWTLALCFLLSIVPAAVTEEQAGLVVEMIEPEIPLADSTGGDTGLIVDYSGDISEADESNTEVSAPEEVWTEPIEEIKEFQIEAPATEMGYARIVAEYAVVYAGNEGPESVAVVPADAVVLMTGPAFDRAPIACNVGGVVVEGYIDPADAVMLDSSEIAGYLDDCAASGEVVLYTDDISWPLALVQSYTEEISTDEQKVSSIPINEPSADQRIFIYDQGWNGAHSQGSNIQIYHWRGWGTLAKYGCGFYTYLHAYQWLTGDAVNTSNAEGLITQLKNGISNLAGTTEWDCTKDDYYANYFSSLGIRKSVPSMNVSSLDNHFSAGGVVKVYTPDGGSHFNLAVGIIYGDIDNNGSQEYWVHIIDSSAYSTLKAVESVGKYNCCYSFNNHSKLSYTRLYGTITNNRSEDNGVALEYWMNYDVFSTCGITAGYLPSENRNSGVSNLCFKDIVYPQTFKINTTNGWNLSGGTLASNYDLKSIKSMIVDANGKTISSGSQSISGKYFSIRSLDTFSSSDNGVKFSYIKAEGDYKWILTATDTKDRTLQLVMPFRAVSGGSTATATASIEYADDTKDTEKPTITDVKVSDVSTTGYTVSCKVSDNVGVVKVAFPTWTLYNDQDDLFRNWQDTAVGTLSSGTATYRVNTSDHNNENGCTYRTHIYAYDAAGNWTCAHQGEYSVLDVHVPAPHTHSPVTDAAVPATCTEDGKTEGSHCSACGEVLTAQETIPATGHSPASVPGYAPTCTEVGYSEGSICSVCGAILTASQPIPATGHTPSVVAGYAPTCTDVGYTDGSTCAVCGEVLQACQPIPATGHSPVYVPAQIPAYQVPGYTEGSYCGVCGAVLQECVPIPALTYPELALPNVKSNGTVTISLGEQRLLVPTFASANGLTVTGFTSKKPAVASVDANGLLTANAEGKAKITVTTTDKKKKATLTVQVMDPYKPAGIAIAEGKEVTVAVGQPLQLTAVLAPTTARATLTWTSSKPGVAAVNANGLVTPLGEGKAKITVQTHNRKKAKITVKVVDPYKPDGIVIAQGKAVTLRVGEVLLLNAGLIPATAQSALSWTSKKPAVATVDANGVVTALKKGKAKITVTTYNRKKATITVYVVE